MGILINLKDSYIGSFETDTDSYGGCSTCDYGSSYNNHLRITFKDEELRIDVNEMYDYALSDGYLMTLMLSNFKEIEQMTEKEFVKWFCDEIIRNHKSCEIDIKYTGQSNLLQELEEWGEK